MNTKLFSNFILCSTALFVVFLSSCKKDPIDNNNNNTGNTIVPSSINVNGKKFVCANPNKNILNVSSGDTSIEWTGTGSTDTTLIITHGSKNIRTGFFEIDSTGSNYGNGKVAIKLFWGFNSNSWLLNFTKGDYEMKRENGKWVSYLKNGEAYDAKVGKTARFKNIELKYIWPI